MTRRVVLLRAVNVGGARLPMARLREIATELGGTEVATHIASGNLICGVPGDPDAFDRALEQAVQSEFGFFREAISRDATELESALAAHPFGTDQPKANHIYFLAAEPTPEQAQALYDRGLPEQIEVIGRELHVLFGGGVAGTKLTPALVLRTLGTPGTARNLNTVRRLIELARG